MSRETILNEVPSIEFSIINKIVHGHIDEFQNSLRAVIAFGPLLTSGNTHDIDLLEVIENWQGPLRFQAESSETLPMYGKMYLNVISLDDFLTDAPRPLDVEELLERVMEGYEIIYEEPIGFARDSLAHSAMQKQRRGGVLLSNPLFLPVAGG